MKPLLTKIECSMVALFALIAIVILPLLNSAGIISDFHINIWGQYLCLAVLAISIDLLWGYTGLLSLGQALFFSLGGYMFGMYLMLVAGPFGSYAQQGKNPNNIPDF